MENEIIIYQPDETIKLDVRFENETVWLSQAQMCELFQRKQPIIAKHIKNIFIEEEVTEKSNILFWNIPFSDKPVKLYSLDVIISVGYRVKSLRGIQFRRWATKILRDHLLRGYSLSRRIDQVEDKLLRHDVQIEKIQKNIDFFVRTSQPPRQGVFL